MEKPIIPEVHPIREGQFVTIPYDSWNALCDTVNKIAESVNAQTDAINAQNENLAVFDKRVTDCETNVTKIAQILEEIYETLE